MCSLQAYRASRSYVSSCYTLHSHHSETLTKGRLNSSNLIVEPSTLANPVKVVSDLDFLRNVPLFKDLKEEALRALLADSREETFPAGYTILRDGSQLADFYIIVKGKVEVRKKKLALARLKRGQFFGEMAFVNDLPTGRSADIIASEETTCLIMPGAKWYAFLRKNPDVSIEVIRTIASRLREADWTAGALNSS